jgi:hypothetical protein
MAENENDPNRDMTPYGWKKALTFKYLNEDPIKKILTVDEVDFYVEDMKCQCGTTGFLWLVPERSGVLVACTYCKSVSGSIARANGRFRKSYPVKVAEAVMILKSYGWQERDQPIRGLRHRYRGPAKEVVDRPRPKV